MSISFTSSPSLDLKNTFFAHFCLAIFHSFSHGTAVWAGCNTGEQDLKSFLHSAIDVLQEVHQVSKLYFTSVFPNRIKPVLLM